MNTPTDKALFLNIVNENKGIIFKVCRSYCSSREDREDLSQEIVYNLWKSFPRFEPSAKVSTWMYRIALNVAISFSRKEKRSITPLAFDEALVIMHDEDNADDNEQLPLLFRFINELKEVDKSVILLLLDDKSYKEIAEITGISITNVSTKINRIKQHLKTSFQTIQNDKLWN